MVKITACFLYTHLSCFLPHHIVLIVLILIQLDPELPSFGRGHYLEEAVLVHTIGGSIGIDIPHSGRGAAAIITGVDGDDCLAVCTRHASEVVGDKSRVRVLQMVTSEWKQWGLNRSHPHHVIVSHKAPLQSLSTRKGQVIGGRYKVDLKTNLKDLCG